MEKMKKWVCPSFDDDDEQSLPKKRKVMPKSKTFQNSTGTKNSSSASNLEISISNSNTEDWMKHFDPKTVEDLAVHNKKIQEVENWLCTAMCGRGEMLLLSGPVGSGKTATVQVLADKYNVRIKEWITPHDTDIPTVDGKYEFREKQSNIFKKFLIDAGCYFSLLDGPSSNTLLLVEDYPNTFLRNPSEFSDALQHYKDRRAKSPIVFICSECYSENRDTASNLFSTTLKDHFKIHHISFNSISATGLKLALKRVSQIISMKFGSVYSTPPPELVDCVVNSSAGDVRSAVLNLHFSSLKGISMKPSEQSFISSDNKNKKTKKKKVTSKFQTIGKDESVTLLHGVGRVLNPKVVEDSMRKQFTHPPLEIVEQFCSQPASFINFLHENYLPHFSSAEHAARAAASLSDADCMLAEWREKFCQEYGLYTAVAGLMVANKTPVPAWNPVRGPKSSRVTYLTSRDLPLLEENQLYNGKVLVSDYKTYCNIINSSLPAPSF